MKDLKAFIWDFDGTLFDTYPLIIRALRRAMSDFGFCADEHEIMEKMLVSIPSTVEHYAKEHGLGNELMVRYLSYSGDEALAASRPFPGVREALSFIVDSGGENYIYTHRNNGIYGFLSSSGFLQFFREIINVDSEHFERKPSPRPINYLLDKYKIDPVQAIMIGDREIDLASGTAAGIKTCHFLNADVPQHFPCDVEISSFYELIDYLKL